MDECEQIQEHSSWGCLFSFRGTNKERKGIAFGKHSCRLYIKTYGEHVPGMVEMLLQTYRAKERAVLFTDTELQLLGKPGARAPGLCSQLGRAGDREQANRTSLCSQEGEEKRQRLFEVLPYHKGRIMRWRGRKKGFCSLGRGQGH